MRIFNIAAGKKIGIKPLVNVGMLMDIPTGNIIRGRKGEFIINGGLGQFDGIAGPPNNFKSRIARHMLLKAADRMSYSYPSPLHIYDTEDSLLNNIEGFIKEIESTHNFDINALEDGRISILTKSDMPADQWVKEYFTKLADEKEKSKEADVEYTAFKESVTSDKPLKYKIPNFILIDSLTKFEASNTIEEIDKGNLDNKTLEMHKGLIKSKFVDSVPRIANKAGFYVMITAHMAKEITIPTGPGMNMPTKHMQYLKQGEKFKGVTADSLYLTTHFWLASMSKKLVNPNTKEPEFPDKKDDVETDLHIVPLMLVRSKSGHSGITIELVVSQREGVLDDLTNFYYIKTHGGFGIEGNPRSYWITLYPDVKLQRTTVRGKLKEDKKLARAVEILADMLQLYTFKPDMRDFYFGDLLSEGIGKVPQKLMEKVKEKSIDWDKVLETRNWWTIDNYNKDLPPYLSVVDLLQWVNGKYTPYWLKEEKKDKK